VNTAGDVAREELARLHLLDYSVVQEQQRQMLEEMRGGQRTAFAAGVAERLLGAHEALPVERQKPYTLGWRPLLEAIWRSLAGDDQAFYEISAALAHFYLSPQHHNEGQDGPDDADDDAVAATYYAAECFLHGCTDFAIWAARRGTDAAFYLAEEDEGWRARRPSDVSEFGWGLAHPTHQAELARQLEDLHLLADRGEVLRDPLASAQPARADLLRSLRRP